jgi:hypothetical protein
MGAEGRWVPALFDRPAAWWAVFAAAAGALLVPLFVVDVPPLLDYPNHMARMHVVAFGPDDPVLSRMYAARWGLIPNLAADLAVPPMLRVVPPDVAGRAVLAAILLLSLAGTVLYSRAAFGGRRSYWPIASALIGYNALFLLGFLNFLLGSALALLLAAFWLVQRGRRPALAVAAAAVGATALFFCHIFAVLFCAVLLGSHELTSWAADRRVGTALARAALRRCAALALVFLPAAALYLRSDLSGREGSAFWWPVQQKALNLAAPFMNYDAALDRATALAVLAAAGLGLAMRRTAAVHPGSALALAVLLAIYLAAPHHLMGAEYVDSRFAIMAAMVLFGGLLPRLPGALGPAVGGTLAALFAARTALVAEVWAEHRRDLADVRASISAVGPGSRVLVATAEPAGDAGAGPARRSRTIAPYYRTDLHLGSLLVTERRAFVPTLFAQRGQQPLAVLPPYDRLAVPAGVPPDYRVLADPTDEEVWFAPYLRGWPSRFDYVLVLNAARARSPDLSAFLPRRLELVNRTEMAALLRVRATAPAGPVPGAP